MNNNWTELIDSAQKLYQQLHQNNEAVQITITADQVSFSRQGTITKEPTLQEKLVKAINWSSNNNVPSSFTNGNVLDEVQHFWQKLSTQTKRNQKSNILLHFNIGASLFRHCQRLEQGSVLGNRRGESLEVLREVTKLRNSEIFYKICSRLYDLFQDCPQVLTNLDNCLTITKIARMKNVEFTALKRKVDETLGQLSQ